MTVTREELVADWRGRLVNAEAVPIGASKRLAWLVRVRIRLYRFLLSLYGDAGWNAAPNSPADESTASVVFDSPDVLPLAGKPAKSEGKIRAVLKSVANSQDNRCPRGTFDSSWPPATGAFKWPEESWMRRALVATDIWRVVASEEWNLDVHKCRQLLEANGLHPRLTNCLGHEVLEVVGDEHPKAHRLILQNRDKLQLPLMMRRPPRALPQAAPLPPWLRIVATGILFLGFTFAIAWGLVAILTLSQMPFGKKILLADLLFSADFLGVWVSVVAVPFLVAYLLVLRRKRLAKLSRQPAGGRL
jgi:hypothetical protein